MGEERGYCYNRLRFGYFKFYDMVEIRKEKEKGREEKFRVWMNVCSN